ncbi:hypothetical protein AC578_6681 [Pseudocercospora eumusae]|uniref:Uncharacterized protein n=1 Tax=Pseudocercospora eumusae TaxID=321146 RepID=A0A139HI32_9PEZI|nr:hypothetical protein AC578_6681 [Pseudocercospora eumusae]
MKRLSNAGAELQPPKYANRLYSSSSFSAVTDDEDVSSPLASSSAPALASDLTSSSAAPALTLAAPFFLRGVGLDFFLSEPSSPSSRAAALEVRFLPLVGLGVAATPTSPSAKETG